MTYFGQQFAKPSEALSHYGVKGMKWGVRNDRGHEGERVKTKKLDKLDKQWDQNEARNAFWQSHNAAADKMNNGEIDRINNKPEHKKAMDAGKFEDWENPTPELKAYMEDMDNTFNRHLVEAMLARGSNPSGSKRYELTTDPDGEVYVELRDLRHASVGMPDIRYKVTLNSKGMITKYTPEEVELKHYGVKGMKWGVRKSNDPAGISISRRTAREASKDAQEFARAKMFYGEGAGNRRKLIKATVEAKSKKDPSYKKAFDDALARQDMSKHASKARGERRRKDTKAKVGKGVRGTRHILNGNSQYASATTALLVGGALAAHRAGVDKVLLDTAKSSYSTAQQNRSNRNTAQFLKDMGLGNL